MNNNNENKLVPKLRFPEFTNEIWKRKTIDEICDVLNNLRKPLTSNLREKGEYPYYGASGIIDFVKDFIFNERLLLIGEDGAKWGAYEKTAFIAEGKYWVNNHAHVLKPTGVVDTLLENYLVKLDLSPFITGAAPPKLTLGKLKSIPVPIPNSRKEQQKIASCLSSLDEVITGEQQKLELLKQHKKGLLQNLFPQEGETVPKLRFKEFENSGEWEVKKLGEVCEINPSISKLPKEFIYIDLESVKDGQLFQTKKISIDNAPSRAQRLLRKNDIIFQMVRPYQRNNLLFNLDGFNYVASTGYAQLRTSQSPEFLYYQLHTDFFVFRVLGKCTGTNYPAINTEELTKIEVFVPSLPEQQKIASCLSSLDDLITAQTQKIEQLQRHKKGLLQNLFPQAISNYELRIKN